MVQWYHIYNWRQGFGLGFLEGFQETPQKQKKMDTLGMSMCTSFCSRHPRECGATFWNDTSLKFIVLFRSLKNSHRAAQEARKRAASRHDRKFPGRWWNFRMLDPHHRFCIGFPLEKYLFWEKNQSRKKSELETFFKSTQNYFLWIDFQKSGRFEKEKSSPFILHHKLPCFIDENTGSNEFIMFHFFQLF